VGTKINNRDYWAALAIAAIFILVAPPQANAERISSQFSRFAVEACPVVQGFRVFARRCSAEFGPDVIFAEIAHTANGLMFDPYFSAGAYDQANDDVSEVTYGHQLSSPFLNSDGVLTIEWRVIRQGNRWEPFAAIVRFESSPNGGPDRVQHLAVIKIGETQSCVIGGVKASVSNANDIVRQIADEKSRQADCRTDRDWVGKN